MFAGKIKAILVCVHEKKKVETCENKDLHRSQSRSGDKAVEFIEVCPRNGIACGRS